MFGGILSMMILYLAAFLVSTFVLYTGVRRSINILSSIKWIKQQQKLFNTRKKISQLPNFMILLPMVREQSIVEETLAYFNQLNYPKNRLKIVVITSSKEEEQKKIMRSRLKYLLKDISTLNRDAIIRKYIGLFPVNTFNKIINNLPNMGMGKLKAYIYKTFDELPSTYEMTERVIRRLNKQNNHKVFSVINYPNTEGKRSDQLNYYMKNVSRKITKGKNKTYVCLYDADSRPDKNTLLHVAFDVSNEFRKTHEYPEAYQQPSLYFKNMNRKSKGIEDILSKSNALFQTMWCLGYEIPTIRHQSGLIQRKKRNFINSRSLYCTGHGEFFRFDILERIGFFPTFSPTDGIAIGYVANLLNIPIRSIPSFDNAEVPLDILSMFKQHTLWFAGSVQTINSLKNAERIRGNSQVKDITILVDRYLRDFEWGWSPVVFLVVAITSIFGFALNYSLLGFVDIFMIILSVLIYSNLTTILALRKNEEISNLYGNGDMLANFSPLDKFLVTLLSPLTMNLKSVGPNIYVFRKLKALVTKKNLVYAKTER